MGKIGQTAITDISYRPSLDAPIGMDILDFPELLARGARRGIDLSAPQRPAFHHLIHLAEGTLRHSVDFTDHTLEAGSWLWVRPGQVHHYVPDDFDAIRGTIVIWQPGFVLAEPLFNQAPLLPTGPHEHAAGRALSHLADEYADLGSLPLDAHIESLRMLLSVLLLRLSHVRPDPMSPAPENDTFRRYSAAVERDFRTSHHVADFAAALGYSPRTLTRATLAATGSTAKQFLDARVLLEAKRLLAHTDAPAAEISRRVGFREPGTFAKFFRKHEGRTPLEFRALTRGRVVPAPE
ncbi:AraC family transcriptional regulator [Streptomyces sp. NPDC051954]|uniref:helix-turn-helix transcriptional regulator n=1 Tax=unclassified Streptomyces TaxID=2593676 RepID=UPI003440B5CC